MDAYAIGCGVLATIEQWYPTRKFNGTMVPHKRNSKVWPGLVTKEKTMKYPISAVCTVCVVCVRVWAIVHVIEDGEGTYPSSPPIATHDSQPIKKRFSHNLCLKSMLCPFPGINYN